MPHESYLSILVIEDNHGDFELIEDFLHEQIGALVITRAQNYKEAKESLTKKKIAFNVILLDLSLPDKTGSMLIKDLVQVSDNVPIIVLTGYDDFAFGVQSISLGVSDYILKDELTALTLYKTIIYSLERGKIIFSLEESEKRARSFARQLSEVIEEERARMARDIHDEFGQQLSGIKMSLSALKKGGGSPADIDPIIETIVNEVNHSIQMLRQIANELRPALLDKLGLIAAIEWLVNEFKKKTGIDSHFSANSSQPAIRKDVEINIFRICQEALTNIAKHSCATLINVTIAGNEDTLNIKITDNGTGIDSGALRDPLSMGLLNMRERANLINAGLHISSSADTGTLIELIVNINGKENINS